MKKRFLIALSMLLLVAFVLSACQNATESPEFDPASKTQVAIFAQATLTKFAQQQSVETPTVEGFPIQVTDEPVVTEDPTEVPVETATEEPTEAPTEEPTEAPTEAPTAAPTVIVTQNPQPTDLPQPPEGSERVSFDAGTTNKTMSGTVEANQTKRYVVWMSKWQLMNLATSGDYAAFLRVISPSGKVLVAFENRWIWYRDYAEETGDYIVEVSGQTYKSNYELYVSIPQTLQFEPNTNKLIARATVPANYTHDFVLYANQGQKMTITLSEPDKFIIAIIHVDNSSILKFEDNQNSFDATLPKSGLFIVSIRSKSNEATTVDFNLTIK